MNDNKIESVKRELKVNGTTILFNFGDQTFINNLFLMIMMLDEKPTFSDGNDIKTIYENLEKMSDYLKKFRNLVDELFGYGSCEKIFGCKLPTIDDAAEFIALIIPTIQECFEAKDERQKKLLEKYGNRAERRMIRRK